MRIPDPHRIGTLFLIALMVVGLSTCKKKLATPEYDSPYDETSETYIPTPDLNTTVVTDIKALTATSGGQFQNDYGKPVTAKGVCWSLAQTPTIEASCSSDGSATTNFASNLTGLRPDTVYYVRAYATNEAGTIYGSQVTFRTLDTLTDIDGNVYLTVQIGSQVWMASNLRTSRYRNGDNIPNVTNNATWSGLTTGAWAHYDNNSANETVYGKLYNWHAVTDSRNICPTGWHVPSDAEWTVLSTFLATDVGFKMKSTTGWDNNGNGSNASGFNGLPGGGRVTDGPFYGVGRNGNFWSSSEFGSDHAWSRYLDRDVRDLGRGNGYLKSAGLSVRCVRD